MPGLRRFQANSAAKSQYDCLHLNQAGLADIYHFWGGVPVQYSVHGVFWCLLLHHLNTKCSLSLKINIKKHPWIPWFNTHPGVIYFIWRCTMQALQWFVLPNVLFTYVALQAVMSWSWDESHSILMDLFSLWWHDRWRQLCITMMFLPI